MMDYVVAVPSYKREKLVQEKTLLTLKNGYVPRDKVTVYVANEDQREVYLKALDPDLYGDLQVTAPGLGASRNAVQRSHPVGTPILFCDDDIGGLIVRTGEQSSVPMADIDGFVKQAFEHLEKTGLKLWGIYAVKNPFFMKPTVSHDLKYVNGTFYGILNTHDEGMFVSMSTKEDWERTIKYYLRDGGVARFNYVATITRYYDEPGGLHDMRTEEITVANCHELVRRYPMLCSLNDSKKSGHMEIRLRDKRQRH